MAAFTQWQCPLDTFQLVLLGIAFLTATVLYTYATSYAHSFVRPPTGKHEPPLLPYWIPHFHHLPGFLLNPARLYEFGRKRYPDSPFTLSLAGTKFHVFTSPESVNHIFRRSRLFSFEQILASMMENGVDLPPPDRPKFLSSTAAEGAEKFAVENHNIWTRYLSGKHLPQVMEIYMSDLHNTLASSLDLESDRWQRLNLQSFLRKLIFETSVQTFFGPRLIEFWPTMWDDWQRFDDASYLGVRSNWVFKLQPKTWLARDRMLRAFERWMDAAGEWEEKHEVWCESWGLRMNWVRDELGKRCGFTKRGRACLHGSFLFVIITNAAPMATWFSYCAASNPSRLAKYRTASTPCIVPSSDPSNPASPPHFDLSALIKDPYVNSLWLEALRVGTAAAAARIVAKDTVLEGYLLRQGSLVLMPVQLIHYSEDFQPQAKKFQAERWLDADEEKVNRQKSQLRPFGGGAGMCSGRYVAEMEIVGVVSVLLEMLDIEFEDGHLDNGWEFNPRSIGIMAPKKDVFVRVRRREKAQR